MIRPQKLDLNAAAPEAAGGAGLSKPESSADFLKEMQVEAPDAGFRAIEGALSKKADMNQKFADSVRQRRMAAIKSLMK